MSSKSFSWAATPLVGTYSAAAAVLDRTYGGEVQRIIDEFNRSRSNDRPTQLHNNKVRRRESQSESGFVYERMRILCVLWRLVGVRGRQNVSRASVGTREFIFRTLSRRLVPFIICANN